jgi:phosphoribosylglycinamide formyltransferase-1
MNYDSIYVITYEFPHRKTYDTLFLLKLRGYDNVIVSIQPKKYEKKHQPLIKHRPESIIEIFPQRICERLGYKFTKDMPPEGSFCLIGGIGILPKEMVETRIIINAHPGYLPNVRGLDALKWAIWESQPIGVTTHRCSAQPDSGILIDRMILPIYRNDTFHSVAQRQYDTEIKMLVESIEVYNSVACKENLSNEREVHGRMPYDKEMFLLSKFQKIIEAL